MKKSTKTIFLNRLSVLVIIWIWMFPVFLSAWKDNWWLLFIYTVWWLPSIVLTSLLIAIND